MARIRRSTIALWCAVLTLRVAQVSPTTCAIDNTLPETAAGNSYECPDTLDDGTENTYNVCCWNDRPDESGNYHTCCQDESVASAEKMQQFYNTCIIIGAVTGAVMLCVFMCTYCHEDTFSFIKPLKRSTRKCYNGFMDAICFCSCLPKRFRRKEKRDDLPEAKKQTNRNRKNPEYDMPTSSDQQEIVMDPFWT
ncbi:uncharacterized protein [Diadema setosum]|uniref:uncharacterized protein n=1 Tax=Diadema setosum TaxID=31175 RepID=UPI003B3A68ED